MENINWNYVISILGVIATIFVGGLGIWYCLFIPKLKYFIEIFPFITLGDVNKNIKSKLKITYDNQNVDQLSLARITICNKGKAVAENFSSPIVIKLNKKILYVVPNTEILTSGIVKEYAVSNDNKKIEFIPKYINQGEHIYFDIVLENTKDINVTVIGRCKGCSSIKEYKPISISYRAVVILGIITGFFIAFCHTYNKLKYENMLLTIEQKITFLDDKIIKQYERLMGAESQRADTICTESAKICTECKNMLFDKINKKIN